jgi:hypothetical protein
MRHWICALGATALGATLCSASTLYEYTGQAISSGADTQFIITNSTVNNNFVAEDPSTPNGAFIVTALGGGWGVLPLPPEAGAGFASWVGPQSIQTVGAPGGPVDGTLCCHGTVTYEVSNFDLSGFNLPTTMLELILEADDFVVVSLNGNTVYTGAAPMSGAPVTIPAFLVSGDLASGGAGSNVLDFVVSNSKGGPTGLNAFFEFNDFAVPEPMTFGLTALGFVGLGVLGRRRRA